jgi:hypothetical protein
VWKADFAVYKIKICLLSLVLRSTREAAEPRLNPERQNQKYLAGAMSWTNPHGCGLIRCGKTPRLFAIEGCMRSTTVKHIPSGFLQLLVIWLPNARLRRWP